jgi:hypothetical protein
LHILDNGTWQAHQEVNQILALANSEWRKEIMNKTWWINAFLEDSLVSARLYIDEPDYRYCAFRLISLAELAGVIQSWEANGMRNDLHYRYFRWLGIAE